MYLDSTVQVLDGKYVDATRTFSAGRLASVNSRSSFCCGGGTGITTTGLIAAEYTIDSPHRLAAVASVNTSR
jgi:hypothetical protein